MIVGIDGSNVRTGGGLTHLSRLLTAARPEDHGISELRVWANRWTCEQLPERPGVRRIHEPMLDRKVWWRLYWQRRRLPGLARDCSLLFVPGGNALARFSPVVTMSRNMLPFDWSELRRYGLSLTTLRLLLLRRGQTRTFRRADGLVFLTEYARDAVMSVVGHAGRTTIIPHGVDERFRAAPRPQRELDAFTVDAPLRLLYVSMIDLYKHQWNVAEAVAQLRKRGLAIEIDFVGPSFPAALRRLRRTLQRLDPDASFLRYRGAVPYDQLHDIQKGAEIFVFASSCENMPNILLEAMAAGFPIACARRGPMPGILGEAGVYFDPEVPSEIEGAIRSLAEDADLRARCAAEAYGRAKEYSWKRCARMTLEFIADVAREYRS